MNIIEAERHIKRESLYDIRRYKHLVHAVDRYNARIIYTIDTQTGTISPHLEPQPLKWCTKCKTQRALTEFTRNRTTVDQLEPRCKQCNKAYRKRRAAARAAYDAERRLQHGH